MGLVSVDNVRNRGRTDTLIDTLGKPCLCGKVKISDILNGSSDCVLHCAFWGSKLAPQQPVGPAECQWDCKLGCFQTLSLVCFYTDLKPKRTKLCPNKPCKHDISSDWSELKARARRFCVPDQSVSRVKLL